MFEIIVMLCEKFPGFTPISIRQEKAGEVFLMLERYVEYLLHKENEENGVNLSKGEKMYKRGDRIIVERPAKNWY